MTIAIQPIIESDAQNALHTFSIITKDLPGVLVRIALVFARRGYNIESLAVSPGARPGFSRMTITSRGATQNVEQITKQLAKLIDVVYVTNHRERAPVEVEIALLKLRVAAGQRAEVERVTQSVESRVLATPDASTDNVLLLRLTGTSRELDEVIRTLASYNIEELTRSGKIVIDAGASPLSNALDDVS